MNIIFGWNVANSILKKSFNDKIYITQLKLNCLVYLIYSEYLYLTGKKLFNETIIKTEEGPVVSSIYYKFGSYGNDVIESYASDARGNINYIQGRIFYECLTNVWEKYKNKSVSDILSYVENGYEYNKKNSGEVIADIEVLKDIINIKENELEEAKSYIKKLTLTK